jgi:uncharacterized protein HemY
MRQGLQRAESKGNPPDLDPFALAKALNERALSLQPQLTSALRTRVNVDDMAASVRLRNAASDQMSEADRMFWLRRKMEFVEPRTGEPEARELIALAARMPEDPEAGNAVFFGNLALGRYALKRGDRNEATSYLRASMTATPTDRLRYKEIDMTLARGLIDAGERTAVAEFLERCAQFNRQPFQKFTEWAAEIRQGRNPDLTPYNSSY